LPTVLHHLLTVLSQGKATHRKETDLATIEELICAHFHSCRMPRCRSTNQVRRSWVRGCPALKSCSRPHHTQADRLTSSRESWIPAPEGP